MRCLQRYEKMNFRSYNYDNCVLTLKKRLLGMGVEVKFGNSGNSKQ